MFAIRRLLRRHGGFAALVVAVALATRLLVPAGFMPGVADGVLVVQLCSGTGPQTIAVPTAPMPGHAAHAMAAGGMHHGGEGEAPGHGAADMPCAFAGLAAPSLAAVDAVLLAVAILFVVARARRVSIRVPAPRPPRLRPPLRAPPR